MEGAAYTDWDVEDNRLVEEWKSVRAAGSLRLSEGVG